MQSKVDTDGDGGGDGSDGGVGGGGEMGGAFDQQTWQADPRVVRGGVEEGVKGEAAGKGRRGRGRVCARLPADPVFGSYPVGVVQRCPNNVSTRNRPVGAVGATELYGAVGAIHLEGVGYLPHTPSPGPVS